MSEFEENDRTGKAEDRVVSAMEYEVIAITTIYKVRFIDEKDREIEATVSEEDNSELSIYDFNVLDVCIDGTPDYGQEIDEDIIISRLQEVLG